MRTSLTTAALGLALLLAGFAIGGCFFTEECRTPDDSEFDVRAALIFGAVPRGTTVPQIGDYAVDDGTTPDLRVEVDPGAETLTASFRSGDQQVELRYRITGTVFPSYL